MCKSLLPLLLWLTFAHLAAADSVPPLVDDQAPQNLDELWGDYEPRAEPLEIEVVREWEEDGAAYRMLRYTIGTFKGRKARMAAFYGFPVEAKTKRLPALLHLHGGGQRASMERVRYATDNGYVGLSLNWGGREMEGAEKGELNTDWGALDATQQGHNSHYSSMKPDGKTLDSVESPRNNNWFLLVLAARRGLTFLEQQPEVDPARLGVMGHSMGGKLTVNLTGIDPRVKVAAPSCGGAGEITGTNSGMPGFQAKADLDWFSRTIGDNPYIARIKAPIIFVSATNDFAGQLDNMYVNWAQLPRDRVRYAITPHMNHHKEPEFEITGMLWFEQHLKGVFEFPRTPALEVALGRTPRVTLKPDTARPIRQVHIYYSVEPQIKTRFWRDAGAGPGDAPNVWTAALADLPAGRPLFVYASVIYALDHEVIQGRARKPYDGPFGISSEMARFSAEDLRDAGVETTTRRELLIDDFARGWHDWFRLNWAHPPFWMATTRKLTDPLWRGRTGDRLAFDVLSTEPNALVVKLDLNEWAAFERGPSSSYLAEVNVAAADDWQTVTLSLDGFAPVAGNRTKEPPAWDRVTSFSFQANAGTIVRDGKEVRIGGGRWQGERSFRNLRWVPAKQSAGTAGIEDDQSGTGRP